MNEKFISSALGLSNITQKKYQDNTYFICDKVRKIKHEIIAHFIIFPINKTNKDILEIDSFLSMQRTLISPIYYKTLNDLHWNIYLIYLIDEDLEIEPINKHMIENDENYARKHILTKSEAELLFNQQGLFVRNNIEKEKDSNFIHDWSTVLGEIDLSGCMYNDLSTESINKYIYEGIPIRPVGRPSKNEFNKASGDYSVRRVNSISTYNYRSFCMGKKLKLIPGHVNLFSGSNGSGKTSICEAIELALTGEIRRNGRESERGSVSLEAENNNGETVHFSSKMDTKKKKELDYEWYGTVSTLSARKTELNNNFSIFNRLDSKLTIDLFDSNEKVIQETIKKMVIGEDVIECEKKIEKYRKQFIVEGKTIKRTIDQINLEIAQIDEKLSITHNAEYENSFDCIDINDLFSKEYMPRNFGSISEMYSELAKVSIDVISIEELASENNIKLSKGELLHQKEKLNSELDEINMMKEENRKILAFQESNRKEIAKIDETINLLDNYQERLEDFIKRASELQVLVKAKNYLSTEQFTQDYDEKNSVFNLLSQIIPVEWHERTEILECYDPKAHETLLLVKEKQLALKERREELNEKYVEEVETNELKSVLLSQLKDILANESECCCPLCGENYKTPDRLKTVIENTAQTRKTNQKLKALKNELESICYEMERNKEVIAQLSDKAQKTRYILEVYNDLIRCNFAKQNDESVISAIQESIKKKIEIGQFILATKNTYIKIDRLMREIENASAPNAQIENVIDYLNIEMHANKILLQENIDRKEVFLQNHEDVRYDEQIKDDYLDERNKLIQKQLGVIRSIFSKLQSIEIIFGEINAKEGYIEWIRNYKHVFSVIEKIKTNEDMIKTNSNVIAHKKEKGEHLASLLLKQSRCQNAISAFELIDDTTDYLERFLTENAKRIELFFQFIHRPKEFSDLAIEEGKISFVRSSNSEWSSLEAERSSPNQMSMGQSVALSISLLFSLYTSVCKPPQILIFDEPIANMDDMHMMNFIDLLREAAIAGTQIFITTANDAIAGLIRRKFSFFGEEFKHFQFERCDSSPAQIKQISYEPDKEECLSEIING